MKQYKRNLYAAMLLVLCILNTSVAAQQTDIEFRWLSTVSGENGSASSPRCNFVVDKEGNTYYGAEYNGESTWEDYTPVDEYLDTNECVWTPSVRGVVVVKIDTLGNRVWSKRVMSNFSESSKMRINDFQIRNNLLYFRVSIAGFIVQTSTCSPFIWMFDTLYQWPRPSVDSPYGGRAYPWLDVGENIFPFNSKEGSLMDLVVTMDLDGNVLEKHMMALEDTLRFDRRILERDSITGRWTYLGTTEASQIDGSMLLNPLESVFIVDSRERKHFFFPRYFYSYNRYLRIDDTIYNLRDFYRDINIPWQDSVCQLHHLIIDSNWNIVSMKPLVCDADSTAIRHLPGTRRSDPVILGGFGGVAIDEYDNVYLNINCSTAVYKYWINWKNGIIYVDSNQGERYYPYPEPVDYPFQFSLDSTHHVVVENPQASSFIPILVKYDPDGNIVWAKQTYVESSDTSPVKCESGIIGAPLMDSQYVCYKRIFAHHWRTKYDYVPGAFGDTLVPLSYFFDEGHTQGLDVIPLDSLPECGYLTSETYRNYRRRIECMYYVVYDRETGDFVKALIPGKKWLEGDKFSTIVMKLGERLGTNTLRDGKIWTKIKLINPELPFIPPACLEETDIESDSSIVVDTMMYHWGASLSLSENGQFVGSSFLPSYQGVPPRPVNFPSPSWYTPIVVSYYLPEYDKRRVPPCPGVDSVAVECGMGSATLRWHGGEGHQLWQVAQVAADSTGAMPDSAAWEQALPTETQDTTLYMALDTCVWLRVRGMCSSGHYGPWSEAVEACPLVGMPTGATPGGVVLVPNPAKELVAVSDALSGTPLHGVSEVEVMSTLGSRVAGTVGSAYVNVGNLSAGTYFVKAVTRRGTYLLKLVVER